MLFFLLLKSDTYIDVNGLNFKWRACRVCVKINCVGVYIDVDLFKGR